VSCEKPSHPYPPSSLYPCSYGSFVNSLGAKLLHISNAAVQAVQLVEQVRLLDVQTSFAVQIRVQHVGVLRLSEELSPLML
jgi:hypothetical protein